MKRPTLKRLMPRRPTRPPIELDFARNGLRLNGRGATLLVAGLSAVLFVFADYREVAARSDALELRLASVRGDARPTKVDPAVLRAGADADAALRDLNTPWSPLLRELELASADSKGAVAVLGIEPDREKAEVRITAEARTLPIALTYVERLQRSDALSFPMLESHEVQLKDPERPVRFQIKAGWRTAL
jgi:hypothetical protein